MISSERFFSFLYHVLVIFILFLMFMTIFQKKASDEKFRSPVILAEITVMPSEIPPTETPEATSAKDQISGISSGRTYFIDPDSGSDENDGKSENTAFKTIQKAIDLVQPGDNINLLPGVYLQDVISKRGGVAGKPITVKGTKEAIVKGGGKARVFEINHDYITLTGFTVDGLFGDPDKSVSYRDKLIYALGKSARKGVTGLKIMSMAIKNSGGECIRLRYFAQNNEIAYNLMTRCGVVDFSFSGGGKNGEGVYIGTAPEQLKDGKNPTTDRDESNNNLIHHNTINTQGNECVDIKEGSSGNIVEYNNCTGQKDKESAGLDSRGSGNVFRHNEVYGNLGAGVRLGGDEKNDGINNDVYGNTIKNNASGGIKFQRSPQGKICANKMEGNSGGDSVGSEGEEFNPTNPC